MIRWWFPLLFPIPLIVEAKTWKAKLFVATLVVAFWMLACLLNYSGFYYNAVYFAAFEMLAVRASLLAAHYGSARAAAREISVRAGSTPIP